MMHQSVARYHSLGRHLGRLAGLLALAALGPACYSKSGHTYMAPAGPGGAGVLFSDGFVAASGTPLSSDAQWSETPAASNATLTITYTPPTYYRRIVETSRPASAAAIDTVAAGFPAEALTFQVDFRPSTAASADADLAMIQIVDTAGTPNVLAQAVYDASTGKVTFSIGVTSFPAVSLTAGSFQTIRFVVDSGFGGTWMVGTASEATAAFGSHATHLRLAATFPSGAAASPAFDFTNVVVTNP